MALELKAGDDLFIKFTIQDNDGDAINLTGGTIAFKIASSLQTTNDDAIFYGEFTDFSASGSDPVNGISVNKIAKAVSALWAHGSTLCQTQFIDSVGNVQTEDKENCVIKQKLIDNA